jgi:hypothetical protein
MDRGAWRLAINVSEHDLCFFFLLFTFKSTFCFVPLLCFSYPCFLWVSFVAYPNLLGTKGYAAAAVVVVVLNLKLCVGV